MIYLHREENNNIRIIIVGGRRNNGVENKLSVKSTSLIFRVQIAERSQSGPHDGIVSHHRVSSGKSFTAILQPGTGKTLQNEYLDT